MSPARAPHRQTGLTLLLLAFAAGVTDAFSFLGLGSVFTANLTGNLVMAAGRGESWTEILHDDVLRRTASFAGFTAGMLAGFRLPVRTANSTRSRTECIPRSKVPRHCQLGSGWPGG
ncbi:DUF1275 family protein [Streptomyces sp. MK7]|uniref:DUF1275 family protein n=1 Tax=Streptomyces sp. MK7 TaxID=3067635 RepID=UPI00292FEC21|nr:DUF1275 family protein [Streptomyces sp. MK7]